MQDQHTGNLAELIGSHSKMMEAYEALFDAENDTATEAQDLLFKELLKTRKAILALRPTTLEEVAMKARLMASDRAFNFWDIDKEGVEGHIPEVILSLIPVGLETGDCAAEVAEAA